MLRTRLLTAIVLIPIVAWLICLGDLPFFALMAVLSTAAEVEFCNLIGRRGFQAVHLFGIALVWLCLLDGEFPHWNVLNRGLAGVLLLSLSWKVLHYRESRIQDWTGAIASGLYVGVCGSYLVRLRALPGDGLGWTLIAVAVTLCADTTAYVVGSTFGRHKLAPRLSSGKTLEGYIGGIVSSALVGAFLGWIWGLKADVGSSVNWPRGIFLGVLIASLAPIGDLVVSMVKREAGVKDSGRLLPGHGGVLDRMDSVFYAAVISYAYVAWFIG